MTTEEVINILQNIDPQCQNDCPVSREDCAKQENKCLVSEALEYAVDSLYAIEEMKTATNIVFKTKNGENKFRRVEHGEWNLQEINEDHEYEWFCSECKERNDVKTNFCPHCGADMRGEDK